MIGVIFIDLERLIFACNDKMIRYTKDIHRLRASFALSGASALVRGGG